GFLAVDSGGSGLRVAVGAFGGAPPAEGRSGRPVRTGERGIDPAHLLAEVLPLARALAAEAGVDALTTAVVGAAGF
ncbi:ATPase, partial [Streptomyces sp. SID4982]|nr:ATPase [Streptomyces sp. SID4982]